MLCPPGIACVQNPYSLVARQDEPILELCESEGIAWAPYFPLGGAFPDSPKVTDEPVAQQVAEALPSNPLPTHRHPRRAGQSH